LKCKFLDCFLYVILSITMEKFVFGDVEKRLHNDPYLSLDYLIDFLEFTVAKNPEGAFGRFTKPLNLNAPTREKIFELFTRILKIVKNKTISQSKLSKIFAVLKNYKHKYCFDRPGIDHFEWVKIMREKFGVNFTKQQISILISIGYVPQFKEMLDDNVSQSEVDELFKNTDFITMMMNDKKTAQQFLKNSKIVISYKNINECLESYQSLRKTKKDFCTCALIFLKFLHEIKYELNEKHTALVINYLLNKSRYPSEEEYDNDNDDKKHVKKI